jgi:hypothetical protein
VWSIATIFKSKILRSNQGVPWKQISFLSFQSPHRAAAEKRIANYKLIIANPHLTNRQEVSTYLSITYFRHMKPQLFGNNTFKKEMLYWFRFFTKKTGLVL